MEKIILNLIEKVKVNGIEVNAKIDTGADRNSICKSLIKQLNLTPTGKKIKIKSSTGITLRDLYKAELEIKGKKIMTDFNVTDRNHLNYFVLIGKNILKDNNFLIDPSK